jgi:uncharacterized protein
MPRDSNPDPRVRQRAPGEETLKLELGLGKTAAMTRGVLDPGPSYITPGTVKPDAATQRASLLQEADAAIRHDLEPFPKALAVYDLLANDPEALANWDMANFITVRKLGYNDHGRVHAWVTGAASLAILELLVASGARPDVLESGSGDLDDTFAVVLLGTMLHDIGNQVHRAGHEAHGVALAMPILERVLTPVYPDIGQRTKLRAFILHSINCHDLNPTPLTLEAGITKGRGRKAFAAGKVDIHSISALAVEQVSISRGLEKPVEISVTMNNSAGIFQVEDTLAKKVINSPLKNLVALTAHTDETTDRDQRIVYRVSLENGHFINLKMRDDARTDAKSNGAKVKGENNG